MALAEVSRFNDAEEIQRRVLTELGASASHEDLERLKRNLDLYESREACCAEESDVIVVARSSR